MLSRIAAVRFRSSVSDAKLCASRAAVSFIARASAVSSSFRSSSSTGVKSPAARRRENSSRRCTRCENFLENKSESRMVRKRIAKAASQTRFCSRPLAENACAVSKPISRNPRNARPSCQKILIRTGAAFRTRGLCLHFKHITRAAYGFQVDRFFRVDFYFFAKPANVHVHAARSYEPICAPNGVEQLIAGEHAIGPRREMVKQTKFQRAESYIFSGARNSIRGRINEQSACFDGAIWLRPWGCATQQSFHPGDKLARAEWFRDVIISAHLQPDHAIGFFAARGDHQDRQTIEGGIAADFFANFEAGKFRQHQVEQEHVRRELPNLGETRGAIGDGRHLVALVREVVAHQLHDIFIIFNNQDASWAHSGLEPFI